MDVDIRLMEALGGHHGHHLQNPAPTQAESNGPSEIASAVSELTSLLRSNGQGSENSSYPNGHLSQNHSNGPLTSQLATTLQLGLNDHALLQSLGLGDGSLREVLGCSLSVAVSTQEVFWNQDRTQNNSQPQGSENSGIGRNSHDEELAEMQRAMVKHPQPATRANSPPPSIHGRGSFSEYSETSPAGRHNGLVREDSQSMSPAPHRSNSQDLEMSPAMDVQTHQFSARNSMGRARNSVGSSSRARQSDPYEDPAKVAERERVRGENRVRKKRWRESNQDRNKDNDLRCRVTKRGNKLWGPEDCEDKRAWMKHEFFRRRAKRETKERARAADETGLNMGAGSSSVFQAYNSSSPSMSAINTGPIFSNFQTPCSEYQAAEISVALQHVFSLLPQDLGATEPQVLQTASRPAHADGEPDMDDEALERLVAESGFCVNELLPRATEPETPTISEPPQSSIAQSEYIGIGDLVGDDSEESMSLEQVNSLIGYLTESMSLDELANISALYSINLFSHQVADLTQDTFPALTSNWRSCQYLSIPSVDTTSRGTKRCSPDDHSPLSKQTYKPPPKNPMALTQIQAILQSSDHSQSISRHQVNSSYVASFGNSENMNKRLMKPPPYRPASKPPSIGITTSPGSAVASRAKPNEHEKKIKSMGFPPLMAGMKPK